MHFYTEAVNDGTIDTKITKEELEMAMLGMLKDSPAWQRHQKRHKDARPVKLDEDNMASGFENKLQRQGAEEKQFFNYDSLTKHFVAGCKCGQQFEIDLRNENVLPISGIELKKSAPYDKSKSGYDKGQSQDGQNYQRPQARSANEYNNSQKAGYKD